MLNTVRIGVAVLVPRACCAYLASPFLLTYSMHGQQWQQQANPPFSKHCRQWLPQHASAAGPWMQAVGWPLASLLSEAVKVFAGCSRQVTCPLPHHGGMGQQCLFAPLRALCCTASANGNTCGLVGRLVCAPHHWHVAVQAERACWQRGVLGARVSAFGGGCA